MSRPAIIKGSSDLGSSGGTSGGGEGRYLKYFDFRKFEKETGIPKLKMVADKDYHIDFLPWPTTERHPNFANIKAKYGSNPPYADFMKIEVHEVPGEKGTQRFLCPKTVHKNCPMCEEYWRIYNGNKDAGYDNKQAYHVSKEELIPLKTKGRNMALIYNHDDGKVYVFDYSDFYFGQKLERKLSKPQGPDQEQAWIGDPSEEGYSVSFYIEPGTMNDKKTGDPLPGAVDDIQFLKHKEAIPDNVWVDLPVLENYLVDYDYDTIVSIMDGTYWLQSDEEEEDYEEEEEVVSAEPETRSATPSVSVGRPAVKVDDIGTPRESNREPTTAQRLNTTPSAEEDDAVAMREKRRQERLAKKQQSDEMVCPEGGTFGEDIDNINGNLKDGVCDSCTLYAACDARYAETH